MIIVNQIFRLNTTLLIQRKYLDGTDKIINFNKGSVLQTYDCELYTVLIL